MKRQLHHRICAYPMVISWVIGSCAMEVLLVLPFAGLVSDLEGLAFLLLVSMWAVVLGFILGVFLCWPWVRLICSRINGGPLQVGDHVLVLSGPHRGTATHVEEICVGQGGWHLARLDLGPSHRERFTDIFEEYSVLKMSRDRE